MIEERIDNPQSIDRAEIEAAIATGNRVIIQFGKPCYAPELLRRINHLCGEFGDLVEVRFYGHDLFDASNLRHLPNVAALSLDCHRSATNLSTLSELQNLSFLHIGIYKLDCPDFPKSIRLENLRRLTLGETAKSNFNLKPLEACDKLEELGLVRHTKNIDCIMRLPALQSLFLSGIPKTQNLEFVSGIKNLKNLTIILGGRDNLLEIVHSGLETLEIVRVRGFSSFENADAFPSLRSLTIEDQIRLQELCFTPSNKRLDSLRIHNCKTLSALQGLVHLSGLKKINISETSLDIDSLIQQKLPPSLKIFGFYCGKVKEDREVRSKLDSLGYAER